jgi:hypothetical protein
MVAYKRSPQTELRITALFGWQHSMMIVGMSQPGEGELGSEKANDNSSEVGVRHDPSGVTEGGLGSGRDGSATDSAAAPRGALPTREDSASNLKAANARTADEEANDLDHEQVAPRLCSVAGRHVQLLDQ